MVGPWTWKTIAPQPIHDKIFYSIELFTLRNDLCYIRVYNIDSVHDHVDTINDFLNTSVHVYMHKYIRKIQLKIFIEK